MDPLEAMLADLKKGWAEEYHKAPLQIIRGPDGRISGGIKGGRKLIVHRDQNGKAHAVHSESAENIG